MRAEGGRLPLAPVTADAVVSVSEAVTRALREAILLGHLRPGQRLVQEELAAQLGTSRQPVREALRRLESEGLIVQLPQRGFVVREYREEDLQENYHLRQLLEAEAARLAAVRMGREQLHGLRAVHEAMGEAVARGDHPALVELNAQFHRLIHQGSGMPQLVRLIQQLWAGRTIFTPLFVPGRAQRSVQEHEAILRALERKDPEAAAQAMREHIARAAADYLRREPDGQAGGSRSGTGS